MSNAANEEMAPRTQAASGENHYGLTRRGVLNSATVAVSAMVGVSSARADTPAQASFGAPLVELHVPAGVLTPEQKGAMIKGITDVVVTATRLPTDQSRKLWVQIFETAESGWGVGGQIFVPRKK